MKKIISIFLITIVFAVFATGCSRENKKQFPSDDEIMENISTHLTNAVLQDPSAYPSMNDFLAANLGLSDSDISNAVLYMGAPNQNTTFFLMLTKTKDADTELILKKLEAKMQSQVETAKVGYTVGYTEYDIIQKDNTIFAIMHEDEKEYAEMQTYLNSL